MNTVFYITDYFFSCMNKYIFVFIMYQKMTKKNKKHVYDARTRVSGDKK